MIVGISRRLSSVTLPAGRALGRPTLHGGSVRCACARITDYTDTQNTIFEVVCLHKYCQTPQKLL